MSNNPIKDNIDIINNFSSDFFTKVNFVNEKIKTVSTDLDTILEDERKNAVYLQNLEKKVSEDELTNILKSLVNFRIILNEKYNEYNGLLEENKNRINKISSSIKDNKEIIDNIYNILTFLNDNISVIDNKMKK